MATQKKHKIENEEVALGFLEDAESWQLQSAQFPSKVGGRPAWLSLRDLPGLPVLECEICRLPMAFLLQVYAPIPGMDRCFHRTLFVFCCKTASCYSHNDSRCMKVFRSQLARKNDFYPYDPPPEEPPSGPDPDPCVVPATEAGSGQKLCRVCGCPGSKACSRCHNVSYCSKHHQTIDWKHRHKKECCSQEPCSVTPPPFLFPEAELVTEPEEEEDEGGKKEERMEKKEEDDNVQKSVDEPSLAECKGLAETDLEDMAHHETEESKVFQRFKQRIAPEPHQVLRYCRGGSPLWLSSEHIPSGDDIPQCTCGSKRVFEFQVMPQLLNSLAVDSGPDSGIDWGTLAIYSCSDSCNHGNAYCPEAMWKQDVSADQNRTQNHREK
ncbi:programmed cell death protein 2 [Aplochiton taeniatus]